jgi:poly(beta-D-mannuronate) lyase
VKDPRLVASRRPWQAGARNAALIILCSALVAACALQQPPSNPDTATLKPPIDVEARRTLMGVAAAPFTCEPPPVPMRDIVPESFYTDLAGSIIDPERYAARTRIVKPLGDFGSGVTRMADRWLGSKPPQPEAARCALDWLDVWARAEAMLGRVTNQGGYERKWTLAAVAQAYLRLREAPGLDSGAKARVKGWFARLAKEVRTYYDRRATSRRTDIRNNHLYWAALAVGATGIAINDREHFTWAIEQYRFALTQIGADGKLPLEVARQGKALHYHLFAVMPLVMIAELGAANGLDLYGEHDAALRRLVSRAVEGLHDPSYFERLTGTRQDLDPLSGWHIAWAEIWYARFRDPTLLDLLRHYRPARNTWLGGDATLAFGVRDLLER